MTGWKELAYNALIDYARKNSVFTINDVRKHNPNLDNLIGDKRQWGHVATKARARGVLVGAGFTYAEDEVSHAHPVTKWRSFIAEAA